MSTSLAMTPLDEAVATASRGLAVTAPDLVDSFREALPRAAGVVTRRLVGAAYREQLSGTAASWSGNRVWLHSLTGGRVSAQADRYAFDRIEALSVAGPADPARVLAQLTGGAGPVALELIDAVVNLAVAYARRRSTNRELIALGRHTGARDLADLAAPLGADEQCLFFERLATDGHNLHPCGRTRLGWTVPDVLAHDLESRGTFVGLIGVRRDLHVGDDVGAILARWYPEIAGAALPDPARYALVPAHVWQMDRVVRERYADLVADRALVPVDGFALPAAPTAALRTLLLPPAEDGSRRYLKLSLDIQVTSTRRTISVASTRNGPAISEVLARALAEDPDGGRVLLLTETSGAALRAPGGRERDLAAIVRSGLAGRLEPGEVAVPGTALPAISPLSGRTVLAELVDRYAATRGRTDRAAAALAFVTEYAALLLPPVLRLAARHGIGLEAHLQNCIPTFVGGVPYRLALRDLAGLRIHPPRLREALRLWPGSVVIAEDVYPMRAKVAYTALQAHLGEIVLRLVESHGLDEPSAWAAVRDVLDDVYAGEPDRGDHGFLTGPTLPHKALLTMRLVGAGDIYVPVHNPLASFR